MTYTQRAENDAVTMVRHFVNDIVEQVQLYGEASRNLFDLRGADSWHHEHCVDRNYTLLEAAQLLEELKEYLETDNGLWEGLSPRDAISAQAAYTYGAAVWSKVWNLINRINNAIDWSDDLEGDAGAKALRELIETECVAFAS